MLAKYSGVCHLPELADSQEWPEVAYRHSRLSGANVVSFSEKASRRNMRSMPIHRLSGQFREEQSEDGLDGLCSTYESLFSPGALMVPDLGIVLKT